MGTKLSFIFLQVWNLPCIRPWTANMYVPHKFLALEHAILGQIKKSSLQRVIEVNAFLLRSKANANWHFTPPTAELKMVQKPLENDLVTTTNHSGKTATWLGLLFCDCNV